MKRVPTVISPSILAADFSKAGQEIQAMIEAGADYIHYDVMDNHFVPNLTFGFKFVEDAMKTPGIKADVHLMIEKPEESLDRFLVLKPDLITFHIEACPNPGPAIEKIKSQGTNVGLAIKPGTTLTALEPWIKQLDTVLVMLVEPGFGGQKMLPETILRIGQVAEMADKQQTTVEIQIDGGIKKENFKELIDLGASNLVMGSGLFNETDYKAVIDLIKRYTPAQ